MPRHVLFHCHGCISTNTAYISIRYSSLIVVCVSLVVIPFEMKQYLRVDYEDDDSLIGYLLLSAEKICMDILRTDDKEVLAADDNAKAAVMYTAAYLYEHREEADHHALMITLRSLLFGSRREGF